MGIARGEPGLDAGSIIGTLRLGMMISHEEEDQTMRIGRRDR